MTTYLKCVIEAVSSQILNNLTGFCKELLELRDTGVLPDLGYDGYGYFRSAARSLMDAGIDAPSARAMVERMVHDHCMELAVKSAEETAPDDGWKSVDGPLYYYTKTEDGTVFMNAVNFQQLATQWKLAD
jgi:hypothetical protein